MNNKLLFSLVLLYGVQSICSESNPWGQESLPADLQDTDTVLSYAQQAIDWVRENPQDKQIVGLALKGAGEILMQQADMTTEEAIIPTQGEMEEAEYITNAEDNNSNNIEDDESSEMQWQMKEEPVTEQSDIKITEEE